MFGHKRERERESEEGTGGCRKLNDENLINLNVISVMK
jgi:hypothetical protein